jgi:hypothetical protein
VTNAKSRGLFANEEAHMVSACLGVSPPYERGIRWSLGVK